jgi:hypothetical protein
MVRGCGDNARAGDQQGSGRIWFSKPGHRRLHRNLSPLMDDRCRFDLLTCRPSRLSDTMPRHAPCGSAGALSGVGPDRSPEKPLPAALARRQDTGRPCRPVPRPRCSPRTRRPSLMGPWRWRPAIVRVAETEGAVGPTFLITSEIARQAEAPGTSAAPGIAIRRLGRRGHRIHCQCQDGENNTNDSRLAHRTLSRDSLPRTLSQNLAETDNANGQALAYL